MFIALEGCDNSGKTTTLESLNRVFTNYNEKIFITQEPFSLETKEKLNNLVTLPFTRDKTNKIITLFLKDRIEHYKVIKKYLDQGYLVITDRYKLSSAIYQSVMLQDPLFIKAILTLNEKVPNPDLTIFFNINPITIVKRNTKKSVLNYEDILDSNLSFQVLVYNYYLDYFKTTKLNHIFLNASEDKLSLFLQCLSLILKVSNVQDI